MHSGIENMQQESITSVRPWHRSAEQPPKDTPFFPQFKNLPLEIRDLIWEKSLPGPRILCPFINLKSEILFPSKHQPPLFSALYVCHESRSVALRRYRLVFGSHNCYADLEIDILFFGPWQNYHLRRHRKPEEDWNKGDVREDVRAVRRIMMGSQGWTNYDYGPGFSLWPPGSAQMRRDVWSRFKGLREVMYTGEVDDKDKWEYEEPGHMIFKEDKEGRRDKDSDMQAMQQEKYRARVEKLLVDFKEKDLSEEEKEKGVPKASFVVLERILNVPLWWE